MSWIEANNAQYRLAVARAALEDLQEARLAHGEDSAAHARQLVRSLRMIAGLLEPVLVAALPELERQALQADAQARR